MTAAISVFKKPHNMIKLRTTSPQKKVEVKNKSLRHYQKIMARASTRSQSAPVVGGVGAVLPPGVTVYESDAKRATKRHLVSVHEDIGSLEDPKAGARIVKIAAEILQPINKRFKGIHNISRKKHIENRCDALLVNPEMAEIISLLETDDQAGVDKTSAEWCRRAVYDTLVELRSIATSLEIATTNEAFEDWDSLAAKTTASEKSIDEKTLKVIGDGAGLSKATRLLIAHDAEVDTKQRLTVAAALTAYNNGQYHNFQRIEYECGHCAPSSAGVIMQ